MQTQNALLRWAQRNINGFVGLLKKDSGARAGGDWTQGVVAADVPSFSHGAVLIEPSLALHAYNGRHTCEVILTRLDEDPLRGQPVQFSTMWY